MAQGHHIIPVSLECVHYLPNGEVNNANIVMLEKSQHSSIHSLLDINYAFIREFRMRTGHKQFKDSEYHTQLENLQWEYFKNMKLLAEGLQAMHVKSLKEQCHLLAKVYKYPILIVDYDLEPKHVLFEYYFSTYHKIFQHHAKKASEQFTRGKLAD